MAESTSNNLSKKMKFPERCVDKYTDNKSAPMGLQGETIKMEIRVNRGEPLTRVSGVGSLAQRIGVKMIVLPPGKFIFQGVKDATFRGCKIAEVKFTNGMFRKLLEFEPDKSAQIFLNPQKRLEESLNVVHPVYKDESEDCPMVSINWKEAKAIAELIELRLPTELERERAAAYTDGRRFPFGNQFKASWVTFNTRGTRSVHAQRNGVSPEGVLDLCGNAWEWTSTPSGDIDLSDPNNPKLPHSGDCYVLRGGSWFSDLDHLRATYRSSRLPESWSNTFGVRFAGNLFTP